MKVIIFMFLSLGYAYCENYLDRQELFDKVHIECQSDPATYADEELLVKVCRGEKVDLASIGPHILCMNVKLNIQKENGEINKDTIKSDLQNIYNGRKVKYILQECTTLALGEAQDTAVNLYKCLHKYDVFGHHDHTRVLAKTEKDFVKADEEYQSNSVGSVGEKEAWRTKACCKKDFDRQAVFDNVHNTCQSDPATYADEELLVKICRGEKVDVASIGPHILCMNVKLNIQKKNGEINKDTIERYLQNVYNIKKVKHILQECTSIDPEETQFNVSVNLYKCLHKYEVLGHHDHATGLAETENDFGKAHEEHQSGSATSNDEKDCCKKYLDRQELFDKVHIECQYDPATYADEELLVKVCRGEKVDLASIGPHILCMNVKLNIQKENGEINKDTIKSDLQNIYNGIKVKYILQECTTIALGDAQDIAVNLYKCLHKYDLLGHHDHTRGLAKTEKDFVKAYEEYKFNQKEARKIKAFKKNFDRQELFDKVHNECQSDPATYADEDLLVKVCHGEKVEVALIGPHILCMNAKLNIQEKNGDINKDTIKRDLENIYSNEKTVKDILHECTSIDPEATQFDVSVNLYKCLHKYDVLGHHERKRAEDLDNVIITNKILYYH